MRTCCQYLIVWVSEIAIGALESAKEIYQAEQAGHSPDRYYPFVEAT
jgi:hypothetical protein